MRSFPILDHYLTLMVPVRRIGKSVQVLRKGGRRVPIDALIPAEPESLTISLVGVFEELGEDLVRFTVADDVGVTYPVL